MEGKSASADAFRLVAYLLSRHPPTDTPIRPSRLDQHREWLRGDEPFRHLGRGITHTPNELIEDPASSVPESARAILKVLITTFNAWMRRSGGQIRELDVEINRRSKTDPVAGRLMTIPGVGPIAATAITALVPAAENFGTGRDFCGLARADAAAEIDQRQAEAWRHLETGRANYPPPAYPGSQCRGPAGQSARSTGSIVACTDAVS